MSTDTDMAATAFDFSGLFEDGHAPGETLPGAPRTERGPVQHRQLRVITTRLDVLRRSNHFDAPW